MRTIAVIPARFRSQRLPGKPLAELLGKTLVERVYERARAARRVDDVLVATDDERIVRAVERFGGRAVMTSPEHPSGTDRVAEAVAGRDADWVVNVQGDEPLLAPEAIDQALEAADSASTSTPAASMISLMRPLTDPDALRDPNVVKVVTDARGFALYFSRSPIPFSSCEPREASVKSFEHVGLYVYPKPVLMKLVSLPPSPLERAEKLEQLRALEHGIPVRMVETDYESLSVDTAEDLERVRERLARTERSSASGARSNGRGAAPTREDAAHTNPVPTSMFDTEHC